MGTGSLRRERSRAPRGRARRGQPRRTQVAGQAQARLGPFSRQGPRSGPRGLGSPAGGTAGAVVACGRPYALNHRATPQVGQHAECPPQLGLLSVIRFAAKVSPRESGRPCLRRPCYRATPQVARRLGRRLAQTRSTVDSLRRLPHRYRATPQVAMKSAPLRLPHCLRSASLRRMTWALQPFERVPAGGAPRWNSPPPHSCRQCVSSHLANCSARMSLKRKTLRAIRLITCESAGVQKWPGPDLQDAGSAPATAHQQRVSAQVTDTCYWESCWVYVVYVCACR